MDKDSGPEAGAKGVVEDLKGKAKEVVGEVTGDKSKEREGRAQQEKAQSRRDVAEHEAEADATRSEAAVHEAEQARTPEVGGRGPVGCTPHAREHRKGEGSGHKTWAFVVHALCLSHRQRSTVVGAPRLGALNTAKSG